MRPDGFDYDKAIQESKKREEEELTFRFLLAVIVSGTIAYLGAKFVKWLSGVVTELSVGLGAFILIIAIICWVISVIIVFGLIVVGHALKKNYISESDQLKKERKEKNRSVHLK